MFCLVKSNLFAGCQRPCPIAVCVSNCVRATHTHTLVSTSAERTSITLPSLPALLSAGVCSRSSCNTVYCAAGHCQTALSVPGHTYERTDTGEHSLIAWVLEQGYGEHSLIAWVLERGYGEHSLIPGLLCGSRNEHSLIPGLLRGSWNEATVSIASFPGSCVGLGTRLR